MMGDRYELTHAKVSWDEWKAEAEKALRGKTLESLHKKTYDGIKIKPLYNVKDLKNFDVCKYTSKKATLNKWKISQAINGQSPNEMNEKLRLAKKRGQTSFYLNGCYNIKNSDDLHTAFHSLEWETDSILFDVGSHFGLIPLFLQERNEKNELVHLKGTIGFDPFEELLLEGESEVSHSTKLDFIAETINWMNDHHVKARCLLVKGNIYTDAGANAHQELVYTFSHALDLINELLNRNIPLEQIAKRMTISLGIGSNFFMEIAKLRAAKHIWASLIHALGGEQMAQILNLHAVTTTYNKTALDIHVNLLRTTTESFSAVVAGVDELTIIPFDYLLDEQSELGERIARNTHFILQDESLMSRVIDPAGGSYYVETLTNELANKAWNEVKQLDSEGGFLQKLIEGTVQEELKNMSIIRQHDVNLRNKLVVGTNVFANPNDQIELLADRKRQLSSHISHYHVYSFQEAMEYGKKEKKIPYLISHHGTPLLSIKPLKINRLVEHFEQLRFHADKSKSRGMDIKVGIITFGKLKDYKPRLDYVSGILFAGGVDIEVIPFEEVLNTRHLSVFILCGKNDDYQHINSAFINRLKHGGNSIHLFVTGNGLEEIVEEFQLDGMITSSMNVYEFLVNIQQKLGVKIK